MQTPPIRSVVSDNHPWRVWGGQYSHVDFIFEHYSGSDMNFELHALRDLDLTQIQSGFWFFQNVIINKHLSDVEVNQTRQFSWFTQSLLCGCAQSITLRFQLAFPQPLLSQYYCLEAINHETGIYISINSINYHTSTLSWIIDRHYLFKSSWIEPAN